MNKFVIIALSILFSGSLLAEKADRDKPISLSSEKAAFDDVKQIYILEKNVLLIKGTIVIKGDYAEVKIDPEGYQFAIVHGKNGLASLRQKRDTGQDLFIEGQSKIIEYDAKKETVVLIDDARMYQITGTKVTDKIHGERIIYNSYTEKYFAQSQSSTKTILSPKRRDN